MDILSKIKNKNFDIEDEKQFLISLQEKQSAVESKIENSMSKASNGLSISFRKKYEDNYLEMYFNERK